MKEKELSDLKIAYQSQTRAIEDYQNKVEHQMDDMFVDMRKEVKTGTCRIKLYQFIMTTLL